MFVSGIGCSSRFPHHLKTYGFHGLHGRALPVAEGIKIRRPDLHVIVSTGDGDCCSIGAGHWIHAIRYNMDMTVLMHDNCIYGLTKMQASPTSPQGLKSNTSPRGSVLAPLNPLMTALSVPNASFVAQAADWIPGCPLQHHSAGLSPQGVLLHPDSATLYKFSAGSLRSIPPGPGEDPRADTRRTGFNWTRRWRGFTGTRPSMIPRI